MGERPRAGESAGRGDGPRLEAVERHVGLVGADLVGGQTEAEAEDFGFLLFVVSIRLGHGKVI